MKRIQITTNKNSNFIGAWIIDNKKTCNDIIDFFENHKEMQKPGMSGRGLDVTWKKSTDLTIKPKDLSNPNQEYSCLSNYVKELYNCYIDYCNQWPYLKSIFAELDVGTFNIQRYLAGEHFKGVHSERVGIPVLHRLFAWMTYLNDVEDGGETFFSHYDIKIKPETGKTLIWPSEWTHAHAGNIIKSGKKYIVTGWLHIPVQ